MKAFRLRIKILKAKVNKAKLNKETKYASKDKVKTRTILTFLLAFFSIRIQIRDKFNLFYFGKQFWVENRFN